MRLVAERRLHDRRLERQRELSNRRLHQVASLRSRVISYALYKLQIGLLAQVLHAGFQRVVAVARHAAGRRRRQVLHRQRVHLIIAARTQTRLRAGEVS